MKKTPFNPRNLQAARGRLQNIRLAENEADAPQFTGALVHGSIVAANDSLFNSAYLSQPLTDFAVGYRDEAALEEELAFFAPTVEVPRRFSYYAANTLEEFFSETTDDERPIRGSFKNVEYKQSEVEAKTRNRGLMITIDTDEVANKSNWQEKAVAKLMRRLKRNKLRRAIAALAAAANNTAKTWDTTAGKDPDQDVISDLVTAATASGVKPNRVGYGDTAWTKRGLAHRAQSTAGGFASAGLTPQQVAGVLGVDSVLHAKARYASSGSALAEILSNLVLMFNANEGMDVEDSSNIKNFVSMTDTGGQFATYIQQVNAKLWTVTVEHYELIKITSTLGIRKFTVS